MMSPLQLPKNAASILERAYRGDANLTDIDDDKWLIYIIDNAPADAKELCYLAMDHWQTVEESERDELSFLKPAVQAGTILSLQNALDYHLQLCERRLASGEPLGDDEQQFYVFGFIALTRPDWKTHGVTVVHCDLDRGKWKVTQCSGIPINKLGLEVTSVSDMDDQFDNIRPQYDDSENTGEDNVGGAAPEGEWQFLVYVKGMSRSEAENLIPDPRGTPDWPMGETCLVTKKWDSRVEEIREDFPVAYATFVRNPIIPANGQPSICKRHPSLFAIASGENLQSVEIVEMQWDQNIARSDEELKSVGRASRLTMYSCNPASVVSTLERLAADDQKTR
jgi:hypothetical protein